MQNIVRYKLMHIYPKPLYKPTTVFRATTEYKFTRVGRLISYNARSFNIKLYTHFKPKLMPALSYHYMALGDILNVT